MAKATPTVHLKAMPAGGIGSLVRFHPLVANTRAAKKFKIPRAKTRERRTAAPKDQLSTKKIDKLFTKFLKRRTGRTWNSVYKSIMYLCKRLCEKERTYVESLYDTYIDLHPKLLKSGDYLRYDGNPIPAGMFFVDASGILRESDGSSWNLVN